MGEGLAAHVTIHTTSRSMVWETVKEALPYRGASKVGQDHSPLILQDPIRDGVTRRMSHGTPYKAFPEVAGRISRDRRGEPASTGFVI
jgi:hypothetical protein